MSVFALKRILPVILDRTRSVSVNHNVSSSPNSFDRLQKWQELKNNSLSLTKFILLVNLACSSLLKAQDSSASVKDFDKGIGPILQQYCYDCHGSKKTKGKVKLTDYKSWADLEKHPELI